MVRDLNHGSFVYPWPLISLNRLTALTALDCIVRTLNIPQSESTGSENGVAPIICVGKLATAQRGPPQQSHNAGMDSIKTHQVSIRILVLLTNE